MNETAGVFPTGDDVAADPGRYVGDRVVVGGVVREMAPPTILLRTADRTHRVTVTGGGVTPEPGDKVRAYGVLTDPGTVRATSAFVVPRQGLWYTWGVSFLAGVWALYRLVRGWQLDVSSLAWVTPHPSSGGTTMPDLLAHALLAYSICRVLSWRYDWLTARYVTLGMVGALMIKETFADRGTPDTSLSQN